jgi:hypothetical protein
MASSNIKLLDDNNNISPDFNETVEIVLKGIHGEKYYDVDEELQDTRTIATIKDEEVKESKKQAKKQKVTFKDFIPVLFFIIITILLCIGGYIFLNQFDPSTILGG